jgi:hypothetical protein
LIESPTGSRSGVGVELPRNEDKKKVDKVKIKLIPQPGGSSVQFSKRSDDPGRG